MTTSRMDRLLQAMADAAARLDRRAGPPSGPVCPGNLFVFPMEQAALEWLVVRPHPDDPDLMFLVPADDFPLTGPADVQLPADLVDRPLVVRCDQGLWLSIRQLPLRSRVDSLPEQPLRLVRKKIAELARGQVRAEEQQIQVDCDPEYERWLARVEACRERLLELLPLPRMILRLADFTTEAPAELAGTPQLSLAAKEGDTPPAGLAARLAGALAHVRYREVARLPHGKLFLLADERGICPVWLTEGSEPPPVQVGPEESVSWIAGPGGKVWKGTRPVPVLAGPVELRIGGEHPLTVVLHP